MGKEETPRRSNGAPDVVVISITVADAPATRARPFRGWPARSHGGRWLRVAAIVALALAALGAIIAPALQRSQATRPAAAYLARVPDAERTAIAEALGYPYPVRCVIVTIAAGNPDYAGVNIDRANGCGHYHGYLNPSLHRVGGAWRLILDEGQLFVPNRLLAPCSRRPGEKPSECHAR